MLSHQLYTVAVQQLYRQYGIATVTKVYINFTKMECCFVCFNWCKVCEMKLYLIVLTDNGTCGNGSLANSLGGASSTPSCVCYHGSEQLSIVVGCLHVSCLKFTAVQQQKWAVVNKSTQIFKNVLANGYCCYTRNKLDSSSNGIYAPQKNSHGPQHPCCTQVAIASCFIDPQHLTIINPWCACAARITVVALCVCICVSVFLPSRTLGVQREVSAATARKMK